MAIKLFIIDPEQVSVSRDYSGGKLYPRNEFPFAQEIADIFRMSYEPEIGTYHLVLQSNKQEILTFQAPTDNALFNSIVLMMPQIEAAAFPPPTLQDLIDAKVEEMKTAAWTECSTGYTCPTSGILMDCQEWDIQKLDSGYRSALRNNWTDMMITDFNNVNHTGILMADVDIMINELSAHGLDVWGRLALRKAEARAVVSEAELTQVLWV